MCCARDKRTSIDETVIASFALRQMNTGLSIESRFLYQEICKKSQLLDNSFGYATIPGTIKRVLYIFILFSLLRLEDI